MCRRHKAAVSSPDPDLSLVHPPLTDRVPHLLAFLLSCSRHRVPHFPRSLSLVTIGDMSTFLDVHIGVECARAARREIIYRGMRMRQSHDCGGVLQREAVWALVAGSWTSSPQVQSFGLRQYWFDLEQSWLFCTLFCWWSMAARATETALSMCSVPTAELHRSGFSKRTALPVGPAFSIQFNAASCISSACFTT
jgi:hypothetical protein